MKTDDDFSEWANELSLLEGEPITINKESFIAETTHAGDSMSLVSKIFLTIGVLLGSLAVLALFFISFQLFQNQAVSLFVGICMTAFGIYANRNQKSFALYLVGTIAFLSGFIFINFGMLDTSSGPDINYPINILMALATIFLIRSFLLAIVAFNILIYCLLFLFFNGLNASSEFIIVPLFILVLYLLRRYEKLVFTKATNWVERYDALSLSVLVCCLLLPTFNKINYYSLGVVFDFHNTFLAFAATIALLLTTWDALQKNNLSNQRKYSVLGILLLLCIVLVNAPVVLISIALLALSFASNYRSGFILSALSLIYALITYYYDLQLTLLSKSFLLMGAGALLLLGYYFINKQLWSNDEV